MTTRFQVQQLDGTKRSSLPQGPALGGGVPPIVINMFLGDSNFLGLDCPWTDDLEGMVPSNTAFTTVTPDDREVASTMLADNWVPNRDNPSILIQSGGRNAPATGLPNPSAGVTRDLGLNTGDEPPTPDPDGPPYNFALTVDPLWSLSCHLQGFYEDNLAPGPGTFRRQSGPVRHYGQYWIKHAITRAGFAREITMRAYNTAAPGVFSNEFETTVNTASLHPDYDASDTMFKSLTQSFNNSVTAIKAASAGALSNSVYVDTVYINAMSFDVRHLGGSQMATNWRRFRDKLAATLGATPNIVCVAPLIGPFEPERIDYSTSAAQLVKAALPNAAWVDATDLALNGLNHLTGASAVELGRRLAMARTALPDAVIRQI